MKVTFLGTGTSQGVPVIGCDCEVCSSKNIKDKRLRTSVIVESESTKIIIDTGPDFRQQMLREKITEISAVIFTHEHKDHIAGLDEVRAFNYLMKQPIPVYATQRVQQAIKREFAYVFSGENYPGIPQINLFEFENDKFRIGDLLIEPINVLHYKLAVKGFKIGSFVYITDANYISEIEKEKIKDADVLVLNALRKEEHISHFTFQEAINLSQQLGAKKTYLTHASHQLGLHDSLIKELPTNIEVAFDSLQIIV
ncbi:MAG: MBL fold metallo-hydrolase [Bacteroidetes bacterium]|nr:MBL fold metallo-hydrolase [Bacteroidota bacterium]